MNSYNIVKIIEKKRDRFIALIEFNDNKKAILKKLTSSYKPDVKKFNKEIRVLKSIDKIYIPQLLDFGKDYYIIEYFDFYDNRPENFSKYVNDNISNKIIDQLIDFKTTKLK
ncbi:MAG: hypothetical protein U9R41_00965, partial [Candidatus Marinimicrobia bacterium]|nr:hypothetical protein [Candidatus Neomarinimicrobiota bacterium]